MAHRDRSQQAGFVYTNIYELYKKAQSASVNLNSRVLRAEDIGSLRIKKFSPPGLKPHQPIPAPRPVPVPAVDASSSARQPAPRPDPNPFDDLKTNLTRLQDLHSRLRFMLKELEDLVAKK